MSSVPETGDGRISLRRVVGRRLLFRLLVANVITYVIVSGQTDSITFLGGALGGLVTGGALVLVSGVVVGFSLVPEYLRVHHPGLYELVGGSERRQRGTDHTSMHGGPDPDDRDGSFFGRFFGGDGGGGFDFVAVAAVTMAVGTGAASSRRGVDGCERTWTSRRGLERRHHRGRRDAGSRTSWRRDAAASTAAPPTGSSSR